MLPPLVESDGISVWVNSPEGYCLGRFGRMGVDIHQPPDSVTGKECLLCTHTPSTLADWETFKAGMLQHYNVIIDEEHRPWRFSHAEDSKIVSQLRKENKKLRLRLKSKEAL